MERVKVAGLAIVISLAACSGQADDPTEPPIARPAVSIVSGNNQTGKAGLPLAELFIVMVTDQAGAPMPSRTVSWSVIQGGGRLLPGLTTITGVDGSAVAHFHPERLGTNVVLASVGVSEAVTFTMDATVLVISNFMWPWSDQFALPGPNALRVGTRVEWYSYAQDSVQITSTTVPPGGSSFSATLRANESFEWVPDVEGVWEWEPTYFWTTAQGASVHTGETTRLTVLPGL
jgi:hypothetical protein